NCTFVTKTRNAISKGAKRILFYMNSDEMITLPNFIESSQVATISKIDGQWLINQIKINKNFTLNFPSNLHSFVDSPLGGFVSNFSQYGPSNDLLNLQPNFLAVGGDIISTVPRNLGNFSSMSGTSMSTPQLAGIAALVKSVRGKNLGTLKLKRILSTTAQQVHTAPGEKDVETVVHQGGGLVDAYCAAMSQSVLSTDSLSLNDIPNFKSKHTFDIVNEGNRAYTFKVGHIPAATVPTFTLNSTRAAPHVVALPGSPKAAVKIDQPMFFLGPKATQTIQVTFQAPSGIDPRLLAVYSGYISVVSDDGECEKHTLPYYGIAGSMKNQKIFDLGGDVDEFKNFKLPRLTDEARQPRPDGVFKFENGGEVVVRYRLAFGSQYVRTDLVPGNATLPPPIGSHHEVFKSPVEIPSNFTFSKKVFRGVPVLWMLPDSNSTYVGRTGMSDTIVVHWNGIGVPLKNAAKYVPVPSGSYKILIRGLRNRGNPYDDDDYDFWLSPKITIARSAEPKLAHRTNSSEAKPIQS
ncbi:hypothetical protein O181_093944, partial [Austropuccinia psidii MF-1]|nr:hypothetical protein [Austropuccinia psidii MF-1]